MNSDLTKRNYARQSHFIVNAKYGLSTREINMILTLLTAIDKDDTEFKDYTFTLSDFKNKTDISMTTTNLNQVIKSLMSKPLEIKTSDKNWKIFNWFSYFGYKKGIISCRFDKALKPYLLEIKERFVISDLRMILPMRSSYSKRMYLLLKEYAKIGSRTFDIKELQDILQVPKSHKDRYGKFKSDVLTRAEIDINKFTDLEVSFTERKLGRKVIRITYLIKKNKNDLKAFIRTIRELYINQILHFTKDNRAIKCNSEGYLYYDNDEFYMDKKEAQKLWEYLHENRENLYLFKRSEIENIKYTYLANIDFFKEYLKEKCVHKKITQLKQDGRVLDISIFPNGKLYDMNGESLHDEDEVLRILYRLAQEDKLGIFMVG